MGEGLDGTIAAINDWCDARGITDIICIGQSMGGYGALLFSALLGERARAIAFAAEPVLGLPHSRFERLFAKAALPKRRKNPYRSLAEAFPAGLRGVLVVGEREPLDVYSAHLLKGVPGLEIRSVRLASHSVIGYLRGRGVLMDFLQSLVRTGKLPHLPYYGTALEAEGFPEAYYKGWCALRDRNSDVAVAHLLEAVRLQPVNDQARFLLGKAYEQYGDDVAALAQYSIAHTLSSRNDAAVAAAGCLRRKGHLREALYMVKSVTNRAPDDAVAHYQAALCNQMLGNRKSAQRHLERCVEIDPANKAYSARLKSLARA